MIEGIEKLDQVIRQLKTLRATLEQKTEEIIMREREVILNINRKYLSEEGRRPDGQQIQARGYSPGYAEYKRQYARYKNTAFVDLKFDGDFQNSFQLLNAGNLRFTFDATDYKAAELFQRYGQLLGIREEDFIDFANTVLLPELKVFMFNHLKT